MKRIIAGFFVAATCVSGAALADDSGLYAGLTLGRSNTGTLAAGVAMMKTTDTVLGVLGGYQFTKNWGAEAFYTGVGRWTAQDPAGGATASGKADAWGVNAVGTLPLSDAFSLYGKLGYANTKTRATGVMGALATDLSANRSAATYGLGGVYNASQAVGVRLGWDHFGAATSNLTTPGVKDNYNANIYSLGAVFKF
ncbi:MAG: outer membrane beta-barrel protein [Gallionella sp.]|nr:outer membrane beta-barrel protein [Gallionella sp.]